jgi:2-methylisocitrate lyase-like PEP mutase family enzyme
MPTIAEKRARFAELHAAPGCFVIPNPFDIGSAKYLASLGFQALASTSAGMAFAAGKGDGAIDRAYTLSHLRDLAEATDLPLNADFEAGFARDADGVHESVRLCVGAGVSGLSIEDYTGNSGAPLYSITEAVDRLRAARAAISASGEKVLLTARSEAIRRLPLYAEAGADVLYVPLIKTPEEVAEVVRVAGKLPVNVLAGWPGFTKRQLEDLGVKRISVGGALARAAWGGFMRAAKDIAENGRFDTFAELPTMGDITGAFG